MYSSVPLRHRLTAVVVAVVAACGIYAGLRYRESQVAFAARLSFDPAAAQRLDPGIARLPHPAVVLGQSILSDAVVAKLLLQTDFASFSTERSIGEFRTRLELSQPGARILLVRYHNPDPNLAAAVANAVASTLSGWAPSPTGVPLSGATAQHKSASSHTSAPTTTATPEHVPTAGPSLAAALGELQAQLSAANQRAGSETSLQSERDRQRYLESQVRIVQQKVDDLRNQFAHSGSAPGAQARLDAIEHALALFWPSAAGINTAGASQAQLDYEREQLARDIGLLDLQQQAARRAEAESASTAGASPKRVAPLASQSRTAADVDTSSPRNPLHLERTAGTPAPVPWWPAILIGSLCGLLYWGLAFARYHSFGESDDQLDVAEESACSGDRLVDTDSPVSAGSHSDRIEGFSVVDPGSVPAPTPDQSPSPEPLRRSTEDTVPDDTLRATVVPAETGLAEDLPAADAVAPLRAPEERDEAREEESAGMANSWEEEILRNLSQTSVARMFDPQLSTEDVTAPKGPARDVGASSSESDRLAG